MTKPDFSLTGLVRLAASLTPKVLIPLCKPIGWMGGRERPFQKPLRLGPRKTVSKAETLRAQVEDARNG